jgi:hypothetical protein
MAMQVDTQQAARTQGPPDRPHKPLSANFAELMASAQGAGAAAAPSASAAIPAGPKPLSANFAELMACAGEPSTAAAATATAPAAREPSTHLDPHERSSRSIKEAPRGHGGGIDFEFFGRDGLNAGDVIDVVNPLQHIPVVSAVYRWLTGDEISPAAELAGGFLYGGPIGLAASAAEVAITAATGQDLGTGAVASLLGPSPLKDVINLADLPPPEPPMMGASANLAAAPAPVPQVAGAQAAPAPTRAAQLAARAPAAGPASTPSPDEPVTLSEDQIAKLMALASGKRVLKPLPPPGAPAKLPPTVAAKPAPDAATLPPGVVSLPPRAARAAAATVDGHGVATDPSGVASMMTLGWDKYQQMLKGRTAAPTPPATCPRQPRWRSSASPRSA